MKSRTKQKIKKIIVIVATVAVAGSAIYALVRPLGRDSKSTVTCSYCPEKYPEYGSASLILPYVDELLLNDVAQDVGDRTTTLYKGKDELGRVCKLVFEKKSNYRRLAYYKGNELYVYADNDEGWKMPDGSEIYYEDSFVQKVDLHVNLDFNGEGLFGPDPNATYLWGT